MASRATPDVTPTPTNLQLPPPTGSRHATVPVRTRVAAEGKKKTQCTTTEFRDRKPLSRVTRPAPLPRHLQLSPSQLHLLHTISCARSRQRTQTSLASLSLSTVDGVRFPILISSPTSCAKLSLLSPCATTRVAATSSFFTPPPLVSPPPFFCAIIRPEPLESSTIRTNPLPRRRFAPTPVLPR